MSRLCRNCAGHGELNLSASRDPQRATHTPCPDCGGYGEAQTDPLITMRRHRNGGPYMRVLYPRIRAAAMRPVVLP